MNPWRLILFVWLALAAGSTATADPAELFPPTMLVGTNTLQRTGVGVLRRWLIKGCDIALYAPAGTRKTDILGDVPRCLELHYVYPIGARQFAAAAWETLRRNYTEAELSALEAKIDLLHAFYRDVKKQDRYKLRYVPGEGTTLLLNDVALGTVPGARFASVYFSVWLGNIPLDARLKADLLAGAP